MNEQKMRKPTVALMQPCYLPWLGLFHMWSQADYMVWLDSYQYTKNSFANRNRLSNQGKYLWLTVPVSASLGQTYLEVTPIVNQWQKKHVTTIKQLYSKAPYFFELNELLDLLAHETFNCLAELNITILEFIGYQLKLSAQTFRSSSLTIASQHRSERVREIVTIMGGSTYLAASGAKSYMIEDGGWIEANFDVYIQNFKSPKYSQINSPNFLENLSILDAIANIGYCGVNELMNMTSNQWLIFSNDHLNFSLEQ